MRGELQPELLSHYRVALSHILNAGPFREAENVHRTIDVLASLIFKLEERLLADGGRKEDRCVIADHIHNSSNQAVHVGVALENRARILSLLFFRRLNLENLWLHIAPVAVLHVRRAVKKEGGKVRLALAIDMPEHVILQQVENECAPPALPLCAFTRELFDRGLHSFA